MKYTFIFLFFRGRISYHSISIKLYFLHNIIYFCTFAYDLYWHAYEYAGRMMVGRTVNRGARQNQFFSMDLAGLNRSTQRPQIV